MFSLNNLRNRNVQQNSFLINFSYDNDYDEVESKKNVVARKKQTRNASENILESGNVNIVSHYSGNKYVFNDGQEYVTPYTVNQIGKYKLTGIPSSHPIAILNSGKEKLFSIQSSMINQ